MGNDELRLALERLLVTFEQPRRRSPVEAPWSLTHGYAIWMVAYGFARLGDRDRARALADDARARLARSLGAYLDSDPIHVSLTRALAARVDMAVAGRSRASPMSEDVIAHRATLDMTSDYKVARVWNVSWILEPGFVRVDAIGRMSPQRAVWTSAPLVFALDAPPEVRAARIADHLEASAMLDRDPGFRRIADCLEGLVDLPETHAMAILMRVVELVDAIPDPPIELRVAVLELIAQFGWGELVPSMFEPFATQLSALPVERLGNPLTATLQALRRLDLREVLARVTAMFDPSTLPAGPRGDDAGPAGCRYAIAGALSLLHDPRGTALLDDGLRRLDGNRLSQAALLGGIRLVALGYAFAAIPTAIAGIERLSAHWRGLTDSLATNSHFCLSILDYVDAIVVGLSEARLGRGAP